MNFATAAWCIGQYAGLRRVGSEFDAASGFDFMHFLMSISRWGRVVVIELTIIFLWNYSESVKQKTKLNPLPPRASFAAWLSH